MKALLILSLLLAVYVGWATVTDRELVWPVSTVLGEDETVTSNDPDYRDLEVEGSPGSVFDGSLTVENPTATFQDVWVTVDVFDGDQNIGELSGSLTLKPDSAATVDLVSLDSYASWTDAHIDIMRLPS